jgi:hypothetical protein
MDPNDPTITCNKVLVLTDSSTTTLRNHIKDKHPLEFGQLLVRERERKEGLAERDRELGEIISQVEGDPDEPEEELVAAATPGVKRPAPTTGEEDLFLTPKSKKSRPDLSRLARRSVFNRSLYFPTRLIDLIY